MQSTLIDEIEAFLRATGLSATRFGALVAGDTKFVKTLREGKDGKPARQPRPATVQRVRDWMKQHQGE